MITTQWQPFTVRGESGFPSSQFPEQINSIPKNVEKIAQSSSFFVPLGAAILLGSAALIALITTVALAIIFVPLAIIFPGFIVPCCVGVGLPGAATIALVACFIFVMAKHGTNPKPKFQLSSIDVQNLSGEEVLVKITKALRKQPEMKILELCRIEMLSPSQFTTFWNAIKIHPGLEELDFEGLEKTNLPSLCQVLQSNPRIIRLNLSHCGLRQADIVELCNLLKTNTSLKHLSLYGNSLYSSGATEIAMMLKINRTLESLNLGKNDISYNNSIQKDLQGVRDLAESLTNHPSLKSVNLKRNYLNDDGTEPFAKMLEKDKSIQILDLSWNRIGFTGAEHLREALVVNKTLTKLSLFWNELGAEDNRGLWTIRNALIQNKSLRFLDLAANAITKELEKELRGLRWATGRKIRLHYHESCDD